MTEHRFETPGEVQVRVDNRSGPVRLRTRTGTTTEVEVTAMGSGGDDLVEQTRVEHQEFNGRHQISVDVPNPLGSRGNFGVRILGGRRARVEVPGLGELFRLGSGEVLVTVEAPEGAAIEVATRSGEITAQGHFGQVNVQSSSGEVSVEAVGGDFGARSESGDVVVRSVSGDAEVVTASGDVRLGALGGAGRVRTASGDVTVDGAAGPLTVQTASGDVDAGELSAGCHLQTASGDQRVERLVAGRARLETVSGDLTVAIARSTVVMVEAESVTGELVSEIDLEPDEPTGEGWEASASRVELRARTVSGDLRIRRAPP